MILTGVVGVITGIVSSIIFWVITQKFIDNPQNHDSVWNGLIVRIVSTILVAIYVAVFIGGDDVRRLINSLQ